MKKSEVIVGLRQAWDAVAGDLPKGMRIRAKRAIAVSYLHDKGSADPAVARDMARFLAEQPTRSRESLLALAFPMVDGG